MSFNKNASKRLSIIAGVDRESRDITPLLNQIVQKFLDTTLYRLVQIVLFCGRKTLTMDDIQFIPQLSAEHPYTVCSHTVDKHLQLRTDHAALLSVIDGRKGYTLYTLKKPFEVLVREILQSQGYDEIRLGKNVCLVLQSMTEHHIITLMNEAMTYAIRDNRDTLLPRDIETILKIHDLN